MIIVVPGEIAVIKPELLICATLSFDEIQGLVEAGGCELEIDNGVVAPTQIAEFPAIIGLGLVIPTVC